MLYYVLDCIYSKIFSRMKLWKKHYLIVNSADVSVDTYSLLTVYKISSKKILNATTENNRKDLKLVYMYYINKNIEYYTRAWMVWSANTNIYALLFTTLIEARHKKYQVIYFHSSIPLQSVGKIYRSLP